MHLRSILPSTPRVDGVAAMQQDEGRVRIRLLADAVFRDRGDLPRLKRAIDEAREVASADLLACARRKRDLLAATEHRAKRHRRILKHMR